MMEAKLTEEVCSAHLDHGDGLIAGVDTELLLDKVEDVIHAGAALAHGHAGLHHVEELLVRLRKLDPGRSLKVSSEVLETVPWTVVSPVQAVQGAVRNLSSEVALEGVGGVLECGARVPVGGEPRGADSDEDGESEDLHPGNVYTFDCVDNVPM